MYIIIDWQNEDDITMLKRDGETARFDRLEYATEFMVAESTRAANIYLMIVEI